MYIFLKKYRFILLAVLLGSIAILLYNSNNIFSNSKTEFHSFNVNLHEKEFILEEWMDSVEINLLKKSLPDFVNDNKSNLDWLFSNYGISIHVLAKDQYLYWTDNSIHLPANPNLITIGFKELDNAYVVVSKRKSHGFTIIGQILIKNNFAYQNSYLVNNFHSSFDINDPCIINIGSEEDKGAILSKNGEYLFTLKKAEQFNSKLKYNLVLLFSVLSISFLLLYGRDLFYAKTFKIFHFILFSLSLIALRFFIQFIIKPEFLLSFDLFSHKYFSSSVLFPSIADLLITVGLISYLIFVFFSKVKVTIKESASLLTVIICAIIWLLILHLYSIGALFVFRQLIEDSTFQFEAFDVLKLTKHSFIGYLILILCFVGYVLLVDKAVGVLKKSLSFKRLIVLIITVASLLIVVWVITGNSFDYISYLSILLITAFWTYNKYHYKTKFISIFILVALFSAYSSNYIRRKNFDKTIEQNKLIAKSLAGEQDPVAEVTIGELIKSTQTDSTLKKLLAPESFDIEILTDYIKINYFNGYLRQYNFSLTVCNPEDSLIVEENKETWYHCYSFFKDLVNDKGIKTDVPNLYFLKNKLGLINYVFQSKLKLADNEVSLFIEIINKPYDEVLGYPELLLEKISETRLAETPDNYAKYTNHQLLTHVGDFPYALDRNVYKNKNAEFTFFQSEGFDHLAYNYEDNNSIIISYPTISFFQTLISFTYIFFFFSLIVTTLSIIGNKFTHIIDFQLSIKNKITFSMILILFISMLFVGGGTAYYAVRQFENNQYKLLSEKIHSVLVELEHKLSSYERIEDVESDYLTSLLIKFSNVFYTDINLYDLKGNLISTSRSEIFERKLTSNKINAVAYRELVLNKKARIVHKENIGELNYYSAYVPFISSENQLLAYLNLPYFSKEILLKQELLRVLVAVINVYAILIILSIIIAIYISNRVTEPLRLVQQRIHNIDLSRTNERINYHGNDEIAELVTEYNRMLDELDKSAKLLAKSERESAWREMARQIAHEIKNPLTPMKLSVQLLERSWHNGDDDFDSRFNRVTKTLIEQIDSLSSIATAFSQFARMPVIELKKVDIIKKIKRCFGLFNEHDNVKLHFESFGNSHVYVLADADRIIQVFNNLIKNAIQAIPRDKKGEVRIIVNKTNESVVIEIRDNGLGISEEIENKLYEPNFTTKNSGTGLGLAIVKNIVEEFGGSIWHESVFGKGSSFFISMPLFKENN